MTGSPISTGSPSKRRRRSGPANPTPWCTSFTSCRTRRCSGSSMRSTGTGRHSTATKASRICSASWPSADRACSRPTSSSCSLNTPRSRRCPARRRPLRRRGLAPLGAAPRGPSCRRPAATTAAVGRPGARGLPGAPGPQNAQRLAPLPPVRPQRPDQRWPDQQRSDQQRPDQQRPDQQRPDQQRPDPRQVPSAGRRYRG